MSTPAPVPPPQPDPNTALKITERHKTGRLALTLGAAVVALGMIIYGWIRTHDDPGWLKLSLAVFGPTGTITILAALYLRYLNKKIDKLK